MPFTNLDKALCDRLARRLRTQANMLLTIYGSNWQASKDSREAKLEFDRLERDARDAGLLAKRMVGEEKQRRMAAAALAPKVLSPVTVNVDGDGAVVVDPVGGHQGGGFADGGHVEGLGGLAHG